jgi:DNA-binding transcriptional ArsR family regulator
MTNQKSDHGRRPTLSDEVLLKAIKLLQALAEPCTQVGGEDHSWRLCRRCMAIRQFDFAPDVTRILVDRVLAALPVSSEGAHGNEMSPTEAADAFARGEISAGKLAELLDCNDKHGFKQQAHSFCEAEGAHGWQDCRCETYRAALQTIVAQGYSIPTEIAKKALLTPSTPEDQ